MRAKLLFMTMISAQAEEGLDYVLQIAKTMHTGVSIILISKKSLASIYENIMSSITFAEEGEKETALQMMAEPSDEARELGRESMATLKAKCEQALIESSIKVMTGNPLSIIESYVKENRNIEMVLLSPALSAGKDIKKILRQQLLGKIDRPVVTIRRLAESTT